MNLIRNNASEIRRRLAARKESGFKAVFCNEEGAIDLASIMVGVIVIGIIAGVIAATVFAVIPWSQDQAASQKLDAVKTAESVQYAQSASQGTAKFADYGTLKGSSNASGASLVQNDPQVDVITFTTGGGAGTTHWVAVSKSATGKHFYEEDTNTTVSGADDTSKLSADAQTAVAAAVAGAKATPATASAAWN